MEFYIAGSVLLAAFIVLAENTNSGGTLRLHFLSHAALIYALVFVTAPFVVWTTDPTSPLFVRFEWLKSLPDTTAPYLTAVYMTIACFSAIQLGYRIPVTPLGGQFNRTISPDPPFMKLGMVFLLIGTISFALYTHIVGGLANAIVEANQLRNGVPEEATLASFAFVKRLALFVLPAALFFAQGLSASLKAPSSLQYALNLAPRAMLFASSFLVSILVLISMSGRLILVTFLLPFVMPWIIHRRLGWIYFIVVAGFLSLPVILVGKFATNLAFNPNIKLTEVIENDLSLKDDSLPAVPTNQPKTVAPGRATLKHSDQTLSPDQSGELGSSKSANSSHQGGTRSPADSAEDRKSNDAGKSKAAEPLSERLQTAIHLTKSIFFEFSFPLGTLVAAIQNAPERVNYRYFADFPLVVGRLVPSRLWQLGLPDPLWKINTSFLGSEGTGAFVPPDLISFGWYSMGPTGALVMSLFFGMFARFLSDVLFDPRYGPQVMYCNWMLLFGFFIMYGSPDWVFKEQFHWWIALALYIAFCTQRAPARTSLLTQLRP